MSLDGPSQRLDTAHARVAETELGTLDPYDTRAKSCLARETVRSPNAALGRPRAQLSTCPTAEHGEGVQVARDPGKRNHAGAEGRFAGGTLPWGFLQRGPRSNDSLPPPPRQAIKLRSVADRKRFFKSSDYKKGELPTRFHVGRVVDGPSSLVLDSDGMTRRGSAPPLAHYPRLVGFVAGGEGLTVRTVCFAFRKGSITGELMGNKGVRKYARKKFREVQEQTQRGGKKSQTKRARWAKRR